MKLRKKLVPAVMIGMLCMAASAPACAAETTEFSYLEENEPTYTVSIPASVQMTKEGSDLTIKASDVAYLDGKKISVTIAGTDGYINQMVMEGDTTSPVYSSSLRYQILKGDQVIETTGKKNQVVGVELASFTGNGKETLKVKPVIDGTGRRVEKGVTYTGTMTYGIDLVDAK
ncbi:hypothetical protein lbkm_0020 [Lachnospiraceae bacterium KM106-2]|nr:hypothetical protein lbkm_0020 [Lachnospiraceae bacterium KM106-2]